MTTETAPAADKPAHTAETEKAAVGAAITAERARFGGLIELDAESSLSPALTSAIADGQSAGEFAIAMAKAAKQQQATALDSARADAAQPETLPKARTDPGGEKQKVNRGAAFVAQASGSKQGRLIGASIGAPAPWWGGFGPPFL